MLKNLIGDPSSRVFKPRRGDVSEFMIYSLTDILTPFRKKVVLKVISQCASTNGVTAGYLKEEVLDDFFKSFWVRRMALDKRNYRQVVETTVDIGQKIGASEIVERVVNNLKDESEAYRKMTLETIEKVIASLGAADIGERLEERLIDGVLHSFQLVKLRHIPQPIY